MLRVMEDMTGQYTQTVEVVVDGKAKATQWIGIAAILLSLGFIILAAFVNWYLMFGFAAFLLIGIVQIHRYNLVAREYIYSYSDTRLVIAKKDVVNRTRRVLAVLFKDVTSFAPLEGLSEDGDLVCCKNTGDMGVYELNFKAGDEVCRLLFAPDEYMTELIKHRLACAVDDEEKE